MEALSTPAEVGVDSRRDILTMGYYTAVISDDNKDFDSAVCIQRHRTTANAMVLRV